MKICVILVACLLLIAFVQASPFPKSESDSVDNASLFSEGGKGIANDLNSQLNDDAAGSDSQANSGSSSDEKTKGKGKGKGGKGKGMGGKGKGGKGKGGKGKGKGPPKGDKEDGGAEQPSE